MRDIVKKDHFVEAETDKCCGKVAQWKEFCFVTRTLWIQLQPMQLVVKTPDSLSGNPGSIPWASDGQPSLLKKSGRKNLPLPYDLCRLLYYLLTYVSYQEETLQLMGQAKRRIATKI